ncbi:MAG: transporter substrate-binding domain-containing protein [Muribaculaceae bacterium]|nr:transporter substrate-binding domain-containing protein [Muribaculaceae bacterium]
MFQKLQPHKGHATLYLLLLIAIPALMIMLRECSARTLPPRHEPIATGDTINVAIEISPVGVTMSGDTLSGTYYNLIRTLCATHGRPVVFHPFTQLETALKGLDEGKYQIVASAIPVTAELKERYLFVVSPDIDRQVLVQLRDSAGNLPVTDQFGLGGRHVTVPAGSPFISRLHNLSREIGDTIFITEDPQYSSEQLIILTALGEIPNAVVNASVASRMLPSYPRLDASLEISFNQFQGWAVAKSDSTLQATFTRWLEEACE